MGEHFAELCIFPKIVCVNLLTGLNICGQIFKVVSEWKNNIEQKQARDWWFLGREHTNKKDKKIKSYFTTAKKEKVSKNKYLGNLLFVMHRAKKFILWFFLFPHMDALKEKWRVLVSGAEAKFQINFKM